MAQPEDAPNDATPLPEGVVNRFLVLVLALLAVACGRAEFTTAAEGLGGAGSLGGALATAGAQSDMAGGAGSAGMGGGDSSTGGAASTGGAPSTGGVAPSGGTGGQAPVCRTRYSKNCDEKLSSGAFAYFDQPSNNQCGDKTLVKSSGDFPQYAQGQDYVCEVDDGPDMHLAPAKRAWRVKGRYNTFDVPIGHYTGGVCELTGAPFGVWHLEPVELAVVAGEEQVCQ